MKLVLDFLLIVGMLLTVIIIFILFKKKEREVAHNILNIIFIFILLVFIAYYGYLHRISILFYSAYIFSFSIDVFIGPLFLVYVQAITGNLKSNFKYIAPHFIFPFLYFLGISLPVLISNLFDIDFAYLEFIAPFLLYTIVYSLVYCIYALVRLNNFQKEVKEQFSNLENKNLEWVKVFLIGVIAIISINISTSVYETVVGGQGIDIDYISVIPIVFLIGYLGYYGISQSSVLSPEFLESSNGKDVTTKSLNNNSYIYDSNEMHILEKALSGLIENDKPFLDPDLTLSVLAKQLQVPNKKLSTLLNQNMNISFYDFINTKRVEEVKRLMYSPEAQKYTLLAIAYDCGFKSKSSFNRVFKKITGQSPSDYRNTLFIKE